MKGSTSSRAFIAVLLSAAFLWSLALSASPELHGRFHKDANRADHTCAVTLIASGSFDHAIAAPPVDAPASAFEFLPKIELDSVWVQPVFLSAHIFAHAPPALA